MVGAGAEGERENEREKETKIESVEINKGTGRTVSGNNAAFFSNWLLTDAGSSRAGIKEGVRLKDSGERKLRVVSRKNARSPKWFALFLSLSLPLSILSRILIRSPTSVQRKLHTA